MNQTTLPELNSDERLRVAEMYAHIAKVIANNKSPISFKRFMQEALYAPNLGYYTANKPKLGESGDFMTAPMSSSLFGQTFAIQFADILPKLGDNPVIVEFGAGTGKFALDCLQKLTSLNALPHAYYIIELSPDLKLEQQSLLKSIGDYYQHIHWLDKLPTEKLNAIVFANEVIDAMPVELISIKGKAAKRMMVDQQQDQFIWCDQEITDPLLAAAIKRLPLENLLFINGYQTEINLWIEPWLTSIHSVLNRGVVFICDYGYQRDLYYSSARIKGTLQCYFKHHVHDNPLIYTGVQDITAHVDFTTVAECAESLGFVLDGFATQGSFLSQAGIMCAYEKQQTDLNEKEKLRLNQELKLLTLSTELAENFKVMALSVDYDDVIEAFDDIDVSYLL
ncbi:MULTISPECIES: class I SAM-dependent methyltransferase [Cysteiniphilum]|uniref:SAM-dependent methyltransferase n=1 Tax=Cysteiniphilum litorale TaxID=2056700 RepID=A0A8J2Z5T0_9GAMM|nr:MULTISPECIES: SAM-dependent methyltransferase [Cysteiniphilum]GGG02171.1 SAM-dependent methyltransferase [Cysteiniphilum litorale]